MPVEDRVSLVILLGPTASGKTDIAVAWAERLGGEIISADSVQVYRYMNIGTAKPSLELRRRLPHHLVDIIDPDESYSAAQFEHHASAAVRDIRRRGKVPLVVGGTGLYIRALTSGLFKGPAGDPSLRRRFQQDAQACGTEALHLALRKVDPKAASRIHPNDLFRIIRALEVFHLTGVPISRHQEQHRFARKRYRALCLGLAVDRHKLYRRIDARVNDMVAQGIALEVEGLLARGYGLNLPAMRAIGYRHMGSYLQGRCKEEEAIIMMKRDTRHYARRQVTWFRGMPETKWFTPDETPRILEEVRAFFGKTL